MFALSILLFIMRDGRPPFKSADINNCKVYKVLASGRTEIFWNYVSSDKTPEYFSNNFKSLITTMFEYNPALRLCLADILVHPWVTDSDVATADEAKQEFARRNRVNQEILAQQRA